MGKWRGGQAGAWVGLRGQGQSPGGSWGGVRIKRECSCSGKNEQVGCVEKAWLREFECSVELQREGCVN